MTSENTFPQRLTKVDYLTLPDHSYLDPEDDCYFLGEYTARMGFGYSYTNNLISNFKKSVDRKGRPEWRYKELAIEETASAFRAALTDEDLVNWSFVPIPPSKAKDHPEYDDRVTRMLMRIRPDPPLDVRELILQTQTTEAVHTTDDRLTPEEILGLYQIDESLAEPKMGMIAIVDDLLTTGAHFRAAKTILSGRFPESRIVGLFVARRAPDTADILEDLPF